MFQHKSHDKQSAELSFEIHRIWGKNEKTQNFTEFFFFIAENFKITENTEKQSKNEYNSLLTDRQECLSEEHTCSKLLPMFKCNGDGVCYNLSLFCHTFCTCHRRSQNLKFRTPKNRFFILENRQLGTSDF